MPPPACGGLVFLFHVLLLLFSSLADAVNVEKPLKGVKKASYTVGQAIPVSCLNRTM